MWVLHGIRVQKDILRKWARGNMSPVDIDCCFIRRLRLIFKLSRQPLLGRTAVEYIDFLHSDETQMLVLSCPDVGCSTNVSINVSTNVSNSAG